MSVIPTKEETLCRKLCESFLLSVGNRLCVFFQETGCMFSACAENVQLVSTMCVSHSDERRKLPLRKLPRKFPAFQSARPCVFFQDIVCFERRNIQLVLYFVSRCHSDEGGNFLSCVCESFLRFSRNDCAFFSETVVCFRLPENIPLFL
jgi:hypothetical protein